MGNLDPERAERECLEIVRGSLGPAGDPWLERRGKRLLDVWLEGSYPETRIAVKLEELRPWRRPGSFVYRDRLWHRDGLGSIGGCGNVERSIYASVVAL